MNRNLATKLRHIGTFIAVFYAATMLASPARAAFHFWELKEVYTDSTGTLQFIELFTSFGNQQFVNGQTLEVDNIGATLTNSFVFPNNLPGDSTNKHFLMGTAGLAAAGGPTPDFIIPDNFLFINGGAITFIGTVTNNGPYTALPTDGTMSRAWAGGDFVNTPTNFAGAVGQVVVPEPATMVLTPLALGVAGIYRWRSRRRNAKAAELPL